MDWSNLELLIVPAITVIFQALKRIVAVGEDNQYIPIAAVVLGTIVTPLLVLAIYGDGSAVIAEAILRGIVFGAASVGLYELLKPK